MFLGVSATVTNWDADGTSCSLILEDNPLVDFVELPDTCQGLYYCNILSGVIRGALEMVSLSLSLSHTHFPASRRGMSASLCWDLFLSLSLSHLSSHLFLECG